MHKESFFLGGNLFLHLINIRFLWIYRFVKEKNNQGLDLVGFLKLQFG